MKLIIGGFAQGKLDYVKRTYCGEQSPVILNDLHLWIKAQMMDGKDPEAGIHEFVKANPDCILISDEIGYGIVPMDAFEREYRERCGRILVELAKEAEEVERVICGIGQRIK